MEDITNHSLSRRKVRSVYLITYSQANLGIFPTREAFASAVENAFKSVQAKVSNWVCCLERHNTSGVHYHMAVKLDKNQRWLAVKDKMKNDFGVTLNFSGNHSNYYSAWKYVTKQDQIYVESLGHPDLHTASTPQTTQASQCRMGGVKRKQQNHKSGKEKKVKRLTNFEVSELLVKKGIKSRLELLALANEQKAEGKTDLVQYVLNNNEKKVNEIISTTWELHFAKETIKRTLQSRMDILTECLSEECGEGCNGVWLSSAKDVLANNSIPLKVFSDAVKDLLNHGRGKYKNIMIVGPANCAKTFLLNPLTSIYKCFVNPASTTFAWVGAEEAEVIFLNDFRWTAQLIPWHDLLLLLEGQAVHLPVPKTHFAKDVLLTNDTPVFCTSSHELTYMKNDVISDRETEMMSVRWKVFHFHSQIPEKDQRSIKSCNKCFAELVLGVC